ncbi:alpha/beta fold hydrolase [Nakamurella deserti]|uniref:alpha/beta fold hydrolase n=1 Tax=Nakamurella deserti TaxID=2164074 RepID=UPI00197BFACC|nr:alpha/beta hydrolase [Nakamurella deserti]
MTVTTLEHDRAGRGEPLVLLHGFGSTRDDFTALLPALTASFEVWSFDLPGHGASPMIDGVPSVAALTAAVVAELDAQGLDTVHVLGNSLGARIALELACEGRARSVVAISPSGLGTPAERVHQANLMVTSRLLNVARRPFIDALSETAAGRTLLLAGMRARPWRASPTEARIGKDGFGAQRGFWSTLVNAIVVDVPRHLRRIDCPVIVAQGSWDIVGSGQTPRYTPFIRDARFVVLPGGGHAPMSDNPELIVDLVHHAARRAGAVSTP